MEWAPYISQASRTDFITNKTILSMTIVCDTVQLLFLLPDRLNFIIEGPDTAGVGMCKLIILRS